MKKNTFLNFFAGRMLMLDIPISEKELEVLAERVQRIGTEIEKLCRKRIAEMT